MTGRWFSPGTPVSFTNKTDHHDITEILLKVVLNTINQPPSKVFSEIICLTELLHGRNVPNITLSKKFGYFCCDQKSKMATTKGQSFHIGLFDSDEKNPVNSSVKNVFNCILIFEYIIRIKG